MASATTPDVSIGSEGVRSGLLSVRYRVLTGALLVQMILGTVYGYSIFWQPIEADLGLSQNTANYAFAVCILAFAATMVPAGQLQDAVGPRIPAIIGGSLMGLGFVLASALESPVVLYLAHAALCGVVALLLLMLCQAWFGHAMHDEHSPAHYLPAAILVSVAVGGLLMGQRYVGQLGSTDRLLLLWGTIGLLAGMGIGFAYVCPIAALVKWFPKSKGLMAGIAVAGFGLGAFVFSHKSWAFSAELVIQYYGILNVFLIHGLVCAVGIAIGAMLLQNPPTVAAKTTSTRQPSHESTWRDTLRRPAFYVLWVMFFSGAMAGLMVIGILKPFAGEQLVNAASATDKPFDQASLLAEGATAVGWLAIFNAVGRIVWGFVSDRIGRTGAFIAMFLLQAVTMLALGFLDTELTIAIGASLVGFNYGGCFALFPSATADLFGSRNLGSNYGWVFTSYGIAGVVGIATGNAAYTLTGSYFTAFAIAAGLCVLSAVLAPALRRGSVALAPAG
jgi:OFA family oxalate/formate antiporter-like MFS transporter